ncbi:MAG TPA: SCE4755 family polysaccharide monooxygenase-like protein [Kofleriaceae bacterium]|nr:SCE4755 family polysaccharide monooxygenase-like protein [Kofleriaceae bacterium]
MKPKHVVLVLIVGTAPLADAHFALQAPTAYSMQDSLGLPEKSAPCGQADPGTPVVATNAVTSFHTGDTITITINELIFHPGHYRVALAQDQSGLPADPTVTAGATPCDTAQIEDSTTPGVLVDNMLPHTTAFTAPQSFQVTLPTTPCTNCTLQVIEFMSDHGLNNPGGCFYHHCAQINIVPQGTQLPDAGSMMGSGSGSGSGSGKVSGGCAIANNGDPWALLLAVGALVWARRRR